MKTESMNNSTLNFTAPETSTNSTTPSWLIDYLEICVYSIGLLFGLPIQSYVLWLIVKGAGSGIALEFFNVNLCVCELGICLNSVVFILSMWFASFAKFDYFLLGFSHTGRPLFQCLICVERYLAVVHPVTFLKYKPLRYRVICCAVAWIMTLSSCIICMFYLVSQHRFIHTCLLSVQIVLVLSIQLFCLVSVLRALKQSGPGDRKREEENHMKRRAFYLILITTVNTVIMQVPKMITLFFEIMTGDILITTISMIILYLPFLTAGISVIVTPYGPSTGWFVSLICFILTGFTQPFLYLCRNGKLSCLCSL